MSNTPLFTRCSHNLSLSSNPATLSANLNRVINLPWSERFSSLSRLKMSHKQARTHFSSLNLSPRSEFFSNRNLCIGSRNWNTLFSDFPRESHLTSVYKRRHLCFASMSSHRCSNSRVLSAWALSLIWQTCLNSEAHVSKHEFLSTSMRKQ